MQCWPCRRYFGHLQRHGIAMLRGLHLAWSFQLLNSSSSLQQPSTQLNAISAHQLLSNQPFQPTNPLIETRYSSSFWPCRLPLSSSCTPHFQWRGLPSSYCELAASLKKVAIGTISAVGIRDDATWFENTAYKTPVGSSISYTAPLDISFSSSFGFSLAKSVFLNELKSRGIPISPR